MIRFGATYPTLDLGTEPGVLRAWAQGVEQLGYDDVYLPEHVVGIDAAQRPGWQPLNPLTMERGEPLYDYRNPFYEPLVAMSFLAAVTTRVRLISGVLVAPQRETVLIAKQAAVVDVLSEGRVVIGVGAGWNDAEFEALGADFSVRGRRLDEQLEVLKLLWTNETVTYRGEFHELVAAGIAPAPVQRPIPILVGGDSDAAMRRAARAGDGWFTTGSIESVVSRLDRYRSLLAEAGRAESEHLVGSLSAAGDPDETAAQVQAWEQAGATGLNVRTALYPVNLADRTGAVRVTDPDVHLEMLRIAKGTSSTSSSGD